MKVSEKIWLYAVVPNEAEKLIEENRVKSNGNEYPQCVHANTIVNETEKVVEKRNAVYVGVALTALAALAATFVSSAFFTFIFVLATAAGINHTTKCCNELYKTVMEVKQELSRIEQ